MDSALEVLDFLNFGFADDRSFKKAIENPLISYDAYGRILNVKGDVLRRTRMVVEEALKAKFNQAPCYAEEAGMHGYAVKVNPGGLCAKVMGDRKIADCYLVRSAEWKPDWNASAQLVGLKGQALPLEQLMGSLKSWADKKLPQEQVIREMKHFFASLLFEDRQYSFTGTIAHGSRQVGIKMGFKSYANLGVYIEMQNR